MSNRSSHPPHLSVMPPDLNSLPQSPRNMSSSQPADAPSSPPQLSHSPSSASHSLAAAATLNAGLHSEEASRRSSNGSGVFRTNSTSAHPTPSAARRRSSIRMNLNINDPSIPGPGEMQMSPGGMHRMHSGPYSPTSTHHNRQPSLGELHQELENEQEAQVVSAAPPTALQPPATSSREIRANRACRAFGPV
jgi:hypothetical protein